jgi:hypothetical protein
VHVLGKAVDKELKMTGTNKASTQPPEEPTGEGAGEKSTSSGSGAILRPNLVAFTVDADSGRIVKLEKVDSTGARRDLSDEDAASLTKGRTVPTLEAIIEQAFEAGIACVLGDGAEQDEGQESKDDAALRRVLLTPLMERTPAHGLQQPEVLGKAILASAIELTTSNRRGESTSPQQAKGSTVKSRPQTRPGPMHEC